MQDITGFTQHRSIHTYLWATAGPARPDHFREVRFKIERGMGQEFIPVADVDRAADFIVSKARTADVYIGVNPRTRQAGTADAVEYGCCLWADLDTPEARAALDDFPFPPSMLLSTGNGHHAYWITDAPYSPEELVRGNRRLAQHLGADMNCTDAARIMRPPNTFNFKGDKPKPVTLDRLLVETYDPESLVGHLPDPVKPTRRPEPRLARIDTDDPLLMVTPPEYVSILTGQEIGHDGKIDCPFHGPERTPSLHVYPTTERGWRCFGCDRGGTIYDFAAELWNMGTRGDDFIALRKRIAAVLLKVAS
jgi:hypothetical protein